MLVKSGWLFYQNLNCPPKCFITFGQDFDILIFPMSSDGEYCWTPRHIRPLKVPTLSMGKQHWNS